MARQKKPKESLFAYFQRIFEENPEWLDAKTNEAAYNRYRADHNLPEGAPLQKKVLNAVANKKSLMKKARDEANGAPKKRRRRRRGKQAAGVTATAPRVSSAMRALEEQLDDCLMSALTLDRE